MAGKNSSVTRREFLGKTVSTALAISAVPFIKKSHTLGKESNTKIRVALVGTGIRGVNMWGRGLLRSHKDYVEMVGLCDSNKKRLEVAKKMIGLNIPTFTATEFDRMIKITKPDAIMVTTVDATHYKYINRAMELGCNAITEKPMATDEEQCQSILDTEKRTGKNVIVTFNYRYGILHQKIKEILLSGEIGRIVSVDFNWFLDTDHGASYFRRWHGIKKYSGTLLVHKATHHFDLMNWWLDAEPVEVFAYGRLEKYGRNSPFRGKKCRGCVYKDKCKFYWDITTNKLSVDLYVNCESEDGYIRDSCLFRNEIDIYDTMAVQVKYNSGVHMTYSLNAFMPYEGYRLGFNGLNGRLDIRQYHRQPWDAPPAEIRLTRNFGKREIIDLPTIKGEHGGGDPRLKDMLFKKNVPDPLNQKAGSRAGAMSILTGIAGRNSIEQKRLIKISELVKI